MTQKTGPSPPIAPGCPLDRALGFLAQAWLADVVYVLGGGTMQFGALRRSLAGRISARVLADRLRQLQSHGLVARDQRADGRREVAYTLTAQGLALHGMLRRMEEMLATIPLPDTLLARSAPPGRGGSAG